MPRQYQHILFSIWSSSLNSLTTGRCGNNFAYLISKLILRIYIFSTSFDIGLMRVPWDRIEYESTWVQVMDWWRQATSPYLNQCWPRSRSPYGVAIGHSGLCTHNNTDIYPQSVNKALLSQKWTPTLFKSIKYVFNNWRDIHWLYASGVCVRY